MLADLLATPGVREVHAAGGDLGVMALHGGLEEGTFEIAEAVADASGASLYAVVQPDDLAWHVPSIEYDPAASPALRAFLDGVATVVSIHGFGRIGMRHTALVGGRNRPLGARVAAALRRHGELRAVTDISKIPRTLRGLHPRNPVNLPRHQGVQLELTADLRRGRHRAALTAALADMAMSHPAAAGYGR